MFAIMRSKKLKSMGNAAASLKHNFRERETLNADPERLPDNEHRVSESTSEAMGKLRDRLPEKRRKDAVIGVEYLMTASPEWFETATKEQQAQFFDNSLAWLTKKYGAENIISASIHRDETTPHMSAVVVPITSDGRLSAKEFIGNRQMMKDDQTTFAKRVEKLGLQRGIEGSKAKHQSIQTYYKKINSAVAPLTVTEDAVKPSKAFLGLGGESYADVAERLTEAFTERMQGYRVKALAYDEISKTHQDLKNGINSMRKGYEQQVLDKSLDFKKISPVHDMPKEDKETFFTVLKSLGRGVMSRLYDKYQMNASVMYSPDDGDGFSKSVKSMFATQVINSVYEKPYYRYEDNSSKDKYIAGAGTFPLSKDTPQDVLIKNPYHAERLKKESEERIAKLAAKTTVRTRGRKM